MSFVLEFRSGSYFVNVNRERGGQLKEALRFPTKDDIPPPMITFELRQDDPLWDQAQRCTPDSDRRMVLASLAVGL